MRVQQAWSQGHIYWGRLLFACAVEVRTRVLQVLVQKLQEMVSPGDEPSDKDKQTDSTIWVVSLSELKATVAKLMKEAAEPQKGETGDGRRPRHIPNR